MGFAQTFSLSVLLLVAGWLTWLNQRVFQPEVYHGHGKTGLYFEG